MNDYILRVTAADGFVRGFAATSKQLTNTAVEIHKTSPVVSAAMGRLLTASAIMGCMLKNDTDLLTLTIKGDGPMKGVIATSDSKSRVKCYPYVPVVDLPLKPSGKLDVSSAIGEGYLNVIKDMGLKEPYTGNIPLISGEIADDLTYYFAKSEQTPTSVSLGVLVDVDYSIKQSGGFIIQMMPDADENIAFSIEEKLKQMPPLTTMMEDGYEPFDIMNYIFNDLKLVVIDKIPTRYYCNCTRQRVEKALISIGRKDLNQILEEDKKADLHCHFCNKDYRFDRKDLLKIIVSLDD